MCKSVCVGVGVCVSVCVCTCVPAKGSVAVNRQAYSKVESLKRNMIPNSGY